MAKKRGLDAAGLMKEITRLKSVGAGKMSAEQAAWATGRQNLLQKMIDAARKEEL